MATRLTIWGDVPLGPNGVHTQKEARRWWAIAIDDSENAVRWYYEGYRGTNEKHWSDGIDLAIVGDKRTMQAILEEVDEPTAYLKHCLDWVKVFHPR